MGELSLEPPSTPPDSQPLEPSAITPTESHRGELMEAGSSIHSLRPPLVRKRGGSSSDLIAAEKREGEGLLEGGSATAFSTSSPSPPGEAWEYVPHLVLYRAFHSPRTDRTDDIEAIVALWSFQLASQHQATLAHPPSSPTVTAVQTFICSVLATIAKHGGDLLEIDLTHAVVCWDVGPSESGGASRRRAALIAYQRSRDEIQTAASVLGESVGDAMAITVTSEAEEGKLIAPILFGIHHTLVTAGALIHRLAHKSLSETSVELQSSPSGLLKRYAGITTVGRKKRASRLSFDMKSFLSLGDIPHLLKTDEEESKILASGDLASPGRRRKAVHFSEQTQLRYSDSESLLAPIKTPETPESPVEDRVKGKGKRVRTGTFSARKESGWRVSSSEQTDLRHMAAMASAVDDANKLTPEQLIAAIGPGCDPPLWSDETPIRPWLSAACTRAVAKTSAGWTWKTATIITAIISDVDLRLGDPSALKVATDAIAVFGPIVLQGGGTVEVVQYKPSNRTLVAVAILDESEAVPVAIQLQSAWEAQALAHTIGLAAGSVMPLHCRNVAGQRTRSVFVWIGDAIARSYFLCRQGAALAAGSGARAGVGMVVVDKVVRQSAKAFFRFEVLPKVECPPAALFSDDVETSVAMFRVMGVAVEQPEQPSGYIGRQDLLRQLAGILSSTKTDTKIAPRAIVLEAPEGFGKSATSRAFCEMARSEGLGTVWTHCNEIQRHMPLFPWRGLCRQLFGGDPGERPDAVLKSRVGDALKEAGMGSISALINVVVGTDFSELPECRAWSRVTRSRKRKELVVALLLHLFKSQPHVLVFDGAEHMDSLSWDIIVELVSHPGGQGRVIPLLLVEPLVPGDSPSCKLLDVISSMPSTLRIPLPGMEQSDLCTIAANRLGVSEIPDELAVLLLNAQGSPMEAIAIALELVDKKFITVEDGKCAIRKSLGISSSFSVGFSERLRHLPPEQQAIVKVLSCAGYQVPQPLVSHIIGSVASAHGFETQHVQGIVTEAMSGLAESIGIDVVGSRGVRDSRSMVQFTCRTARQIAYSTLTIEQRAEIHAAVASWYETVHSNGLTPHLALLAYHHGHAGNTPDAISYLGQCGEFSRNCRADESAMRHLDEALELGGHHPKLGAGPPAPVLAPLIPQRELPRRFYADAFVSLSLVYDTLGVESQAQCLRCLKKALDLMDQPEPQEGKGALWSQLLEQYKRGGDRDYLAVRAAGARSGHRVAARAYLEYARLLARAPTLDRRTENALVRAVNVAEQAGPCAELAVAYALFGQFAGTGYGAKWAEKYFTLAEGVLKQISGSPYLEESRSAVSLARLRFSLSSGDVVGTRVLGLEVMKHVVEKGEMLTRRRVSAQLAVSYFFLCDFSNGRKLGLEELDAAVSARDYAMEAQAHLLLALFTPLLGAARGPIEASEHVELARSIVFKGSESSPTDAPVRSNFVRCSLNTFSAILRGGGDWHSDFGVRSSVGESTVGSMAGFAAAIGPLELRSPDAFSVLCMAMIANTALNALESEMASSTEELNPDEEYATPTTPIPAAPPSGSIAIVTRIVDSLSAVSKRCVLGRPDAKLSRGRLTLLMGRTKKKKAIGYLKESIRSADELHIPLAGVKARLYLARALGGGIEAELMRAQAMEIMPKLGDEK